MSNDPKNKLTMITRVNTWRGQTIELGEDSESIFIKIYSMPWFFEIFIWYSPLFILFLLSMFLGSFYPMLFFYVLFIGMPLLGLFGKEHGFTYWAKIVSHLNYYIGRTNTIIFIKNNSSKIYLHSNNKQIFQLDELKGIGFIGEIENSKTTISQGYYLVCRICLIINDELILPIGGVYGSFFTSNLKQKKEFETLYFELSRLLRSPLLITPSHEGVIYSYYSCEIGHKTIGSYNYKFRQNKNAYKLISRKDQFSIWQITIFAIPEFVSLIPYLCINYILQNVNINNQILIVVLLFLEVIFGFILFFSFLEWTYEMSSYLRWEGLISPKSISYFTFNRN